jgi:hypothetical protein
VEDKRYNYFGYLLLCASFISVFTLPRRACALTNPARSIPDEGTRIAEAVRVDHAPKLDGTLNDPALASVVSRIAMARCG